MIRDTYILSYCCWAGTTLECWQLVAVFASLEEGREFASTAGYSSWILEKN